MKVKCIETRLTDDQKNRIRLIDSSQPHYGTALIIGKEYTVLGITYVVDTFWTTPLFDLKAEIGHCLQVPVCLFEITDPRPSVFWRARQKFPNFTLWPVEFYRDFFHDDLREGKPEIKRVFDIVVDRLTYEFEDVASVKTDREMMETQAYRNIKTGMLVEPKIKFIGRKNES